ncbi:hypothetical protein [Halochromatium glycolicum]|uniref:hypothetical protein n=1 Tax=Halochromatium glycolicum TaxID=85075 RepID=UPI00190AFC73|nr:hypothetical protein [Halochromatium glycolicum]
MLAFIFHLKTYDERGFTLMMTPARTHLSRLLASLALAGTVLVTPTVQAGVFNSSTVADLLLTGITTTDPNGDFTGLTIDGFPDFETDTFGTGTANVDANVEFFDDPFGVGVGIDAVLNASSNAQAGKGEIVDALADSFAFIDIFNGTDDEITIDFFLNWDLEAAASAPANGDAYAEAFFAFEAIGNVVGGNDFISELIIADALFGPPDAMTSGDNPFTLLLEPDGLATIDIATGTIGFADGIPVPVPPVSMLMALGFVTLIGARLGVTARRAKS